MLGLAFVVILSNVLGMLEVITKLAPPTTLNVLAFALVIGSLSLRRRGGGTRR